MKTDKALLFRIRVWRGLASHYILFPNSHKFFIFVYCTEKYELHFRQKELYSPSPPGCRLARGMKCIDFGVDQSIKIRLGRTLKMGAL